MPILDCQLYSPPIHHRGRQAAFTLIEVMVVLVIVAVLAGLVVISAPGESADFDREAKRLHLLFDMARREAMLDSTEFGFKATDREYRFLSYDDASQSWVAAPPPFKARTLPDEFSLHVKAARTSWSLPGAPPVLILSSGEMTPFELSLESRRTGSLRVLQSDGYGDLSDRSE